MAKTEKPWGYEEIIFSTEINSGRGYVPIALKKFAIDSEQMTSFHLHKKINEILYVNKGMVEIRLENDVISLNEGQSYFIEAKTPHQIQNITSEVVEVIEVSFPFDPEDEERIEDPYAEKR